MKRRSVEIEPKASEMTAEFVGADLSRMAGELEKLIITLPREQKRITPEQIERNIGISKDYNNFELRNALVAKDVFKANQIIKYFYIVLFIFTCITLMLYPRNIKLLPCCNSVLFGLKRINRDIAFLFDL